MVKLESGYSFIGEYFFDFDKYFAIEHNACMNGAVGTNNMNFSILKKIVENDFKEYPLYKLNIYPKPQRLMIYQHNSLNIFFLTDWEERCEMCYGSEIEIIDYIKDILDKSKVVKKDNESEVHVLLTSSGGFDTQKVRFESKPLDLENHYNDDFADEYGKVVDLIQEHDTGLILWHGTTGTGKTTAIRHLMSENFDRKFIFIPSGYAEILGEPSFNNMLIRPEYRGSVLIIEDAESLLRAQAHRTSGMSNLLNITDGLMVDVFGCLVIATCNVDIKHVDNAIMRGGRMKSKYEFKPLSKEKSKRLTGIDKELTLAEVFNGVNKSENNSMGFKMK